MKVLLLGKGHIIERYSLISINCENWISRYMDGHEFITFGYNDGVDIQINVDDDFEKVIEKLPKGWSPDVCLLWEVDWNLIPLGIENAPFPTVSISWDWDYDIPLAKGIFELTDFTVALGDFEKESIEAIGADNVGLYYFVGVKQEYFVTKPKKINERKYDVIYTTWINDVVLSDRSEWIQKLCSLSDKYNICIDNPIQSYSDYNARLADSKMVFSHHRYGSMSGRVIEAGAQGAIVLETGDEVKKYFDIDNEFISINKDNFAEKIEMFLEDEQKLQDMSDRVHEKVSEGFEASQRFFGLLELIDENIKATKSNRKFTRLSEEQKHFRQGEIFYYSFFRTPNYILHGRSKMLEKSIDEFTKAVNAEETPRGMTSLAVATATYDFTFRKSEIMEDKGSDVELILQKVISSYPSYAMAYFHLGVVYLRVRKFHEALNVFTSALKLLKNSSSDIDPWCLYIVDFEEFALKKAINSNLLLLSKGDKGAINNIRDIYQAAIEYYISLVQKELGFMHQSLETLLNSHKAHPKTGLVAEKAADLLSCLGFKNESIAMYKKAIELLPFNIELRVDYIQALYLHEMDKTAIDEINKIMELMKTVHGIKDKYPLVQDMLESFGRIKSRLLLSHDSCKDKIHNEWVQRLYSSLKKDPGNLKLIMRINELWYQLGRVDKVIELMECYLKKYFHREQLDSKDMACLKDILDTLKHKVTERNERNCSRLKKLSGKLHLARESADVL